MDEAKSRSSTTQKRTRPISSQLDQATLINNGHTMLPTFIRRGGEHCVTPAQAAAKETRSINFPSGTKAGNSEQANQQDTAFASSWPLAVSAI